MILLLTLDPEKDGCESTSDKSICQLCLHIANKKIVISDAFDYSFRKISAALTRSLYFAIKKVEIFMISKELLEILCCPETKADLVLDGETLVSIDKNTRRRYRIENDIPIMLIDESEQLSIEEWKSIMKKHGRDAE